MCFLVVEAHKKEKKETHTELSKKKFTEHHLEHDEQNIYNCKKNEEKKTPEEVKETNISTVHTVPQE